MILTEKHIIKSTHLFFSECDSLCFNSKNLYNQSLYNLRQHYFETKTYLSYTENYHKIKNIDNYKTLPAKVASQIPLLVDQNFKSFFGLLKTSGSVAKIPKYLDKTSGRYLTKFPKQALNKMPFKKRGEIALSQTNISIKTQITDWNSIKEVRIVPRRGHYVIEVVYERQEKVATGKVIASIDPGLNNLATVAFNDKNVAPFIINGRPLKSINQFYNKKRAEMQSILEKELNRKTSKRLDKLTYKRNQKVNDFMHKASRALVNQLAKNNVGTLIIGKNTGQKQDINIGRVNNQNFVQAPIFRFLDMVAYKARLDGIKVIWQEESYTSKCSFFDQEEVCKHESYVGTRVERGLFKTRDGSLVNADLNGALNILRKAIPEAFADGTEGVAVHPMQMKFFA